MVEELTELANRTNQDNESSAILYIFLARIVNLMASVGRSTSTSFLVWKVLELETKIGYADFASTVIQDFVLKEKHLFYLSYSVADYYA